MRILLLSNLYPPYVQGGAEILAGDIARSLEKLGHEVIVLTGEYGLRGGRQEGPIWRTLQNAHDAHFDRRSSMWRQLGLLSSYYRQFHNARNSRELNRVIAVTKPDILYVWEITGIGLNSLVAELHKVTIPIVFHLGSYWLHYAHAAQTEHSHLRLRWLKKTLIGSVPELTYTSLIAVSGTVKEEYVEVGCKAEDIEVIYNGIDARFFDTRQLRDASSSATHGEVRLMYVGRLRVEKGVIVILKALDLLRQQGRQYIRLDIFGDGDTAYIGELQAFMREKHLEQAVTFHGKVPQDELIGCYDNSDIMLIPSLWKEPFGLVVVEAMARGLPVIASNVGGPAEIITHGENGLLVEAGNAQALAAAILRLIEHPEERERISGAAQTLVRTRFTMAKNARAVEQHLLRALKRRRL